MNNIINYSLLYIFSFATTTLLTWFLIKYLPSFGVVDIPSKRRPHNEVTPRGGGLAIVLVTIIAFSIFEYLTTYEFSFSIKILPLLIIIAMVSFLDDLKPMPVFVRLITHFICASFAVFFFLPETFMHIYGLPSYFIFFISVLAVSGFINIYNFMDGIDGLSCIESIHLASNMLILCFLQFANITNVYFIITLNTIILSCSCSFLIFNWHPAKIFLGDVGSISIGFLIGVCLLLIASTNIELFTACFIASLYYLADAGLTILIRLINMEKIWQPHLKHFFQKAVQRGKSHKQVVANIAICNIFLLILSISSLYYPLTSIMLALALVTLTIQNLLK